MFLRLLLRALVGAALLIPMIPLAVPQAVQAAQNPCAANPPVGAPGAPQNVQAALNDTTATVSWQPPGGGESTTIAGYHVYSSDGREVDVGAQNTSAVFSGLTYRTQYTFTVCAY